MRDKSTRVTDAANDLKKPFDALKIEIGHVYPSVPYNLQRVQFSYQEDSEVAIDAVLAIKKILD